MKKQMTRVISLSLLVALVLGLFGGIPALTTTAASAEADAKVGVLLNPGFEEIDSETGLPKYWNVLNTNTLSVVDTDSAPDNVFEGKYALKISCPATGVGYSNGVVSDYIPIKAGVTYEVTVAGKDIVTSTRGFQVGIFYHDADKNQLLSVYNTGPVSGEWNYTSMSCTAPADAAYARVYVVNGAATGEGYFDSVTFTESDGYNSLPTMYDGEWKLSSTEYPRLYFSKSDLAKIKEFANSKEISAYGYDGASVKDALIKEADGYLAETTMSILHNGINLVYDLSPVLKDPTARVEFETSPNGYDPGYPYMTAVGQALVSRMKALTMAYALTGDTKYGERAKQYALDICDWEWWVGYYQTVIVGGHSEHSSQPTGYIVECVMMAYDMCNDLLSARDKEKIEKALIEKGLEAEYHDCWPRMNRMRDMDHATGLVLASLTIMNENNIDQLKKYLDMGVTYINWRLDHFMYSGINEGDDYDSLAVDDIILTLAMMERVTGKTGFMEHPYIDELEKRIVGAFEPVKGTMPAYSDSSLTSTNYPYSAAVFSQRGNKMVTYYLAKGGALSNNMDKLIYHTDETLEELEMPSEREGNVVYVGSAGFGTLRTGWGALDTTLVVRTNTSEQSHNHYDQNSIQIAFNGNWILSDTAYQDLTYSDLQVWQSKYTNSTIFVDGKTQVHKGHGSLEQVFNTHVYGYLLGSAPEAYGMEDRQPVLNQFDRHMIMLNHDENPYYVIIDDLDSNKDRSYGWNFFMNGWDRLEIDGKTVEKGSSGIGNNVAIAKSGAILHSYFVGDSKVTSKEISYAGYGPTLALESEKAKNHQFMNILSVEQSAGGQWVTIFQNLRPEGETKTKETERIKEGQISWSSTRENPESSTTLNVAVGAPLIMFRAGNAGDWISFPFNVEADDEYMLSATAAITTGYKGLWDLYIDDVLVMPEFNPNKTSGGNELVSLDLGKLNLTKGAHTFKAVLKSTPNTAMAGTIFSLGSISLDNGDGLGNGKINVLESYDDGDLLGATINYGTALNDVVLFNRGTGSIAGGKLATNGQQASVLGASETAVNEGYAVTNGTSLKYGDQVLVTADGAVSLAVDFTLAKDGKAEEGFNAAKPVIYISSKADAARTASVYIGIDAGYTATVDGEAVAVTYANGMLTLNVPEGEHEIVVTGDTTVAPGPAPAPEGGEDQPDATSDSTAIVGMLAVMILAVTTVATMVIGTKKKVF